MDGEKMFFGGVGALLMALILSVTAYNVIVQNNIAEAVAKGVEPIAAMCAFDYSESKRITCHQYAVEGTKEAHKVVSNQNKE